MSNKDNDVQKLRDIILGKKFIIPLYQRNYKWGKEEVVKLINDFIDSYSPTYKTKSIGLITLHKKEERGEEYEVIDGQQRLITLAIIFYLLTDNKDDNGNKIIDLKFERDEDNTDRNRLSAIKGEYEENKFVSTDVDRINRNRKWICECLEDTIEKGKFAKFILEHCNMLCSYIEQNPEAEFMNLNAYKTKFSVCDHVRANMISLNSFYKEDLEKENVKIYLADALEKNSYKTSIAHLYNDILKILYDEEDSSGEENGEKSIFAYVLGKNPIETLNSEKSKESKESRINFLFMDKKDKEDKNYYCNSINENLDYWIKMILKLACVKRILTQLQEEWHRGEFSSFKQIDDYHALKKENFLRSNIMYSDKGEEEINALTLSQLLKKKSNVASILLSDLKNVDQRLANRYMESFVNSKENKETNTVVENFVLPEDEKEQGKVQLYTMPKEELFEEIQGVGRQVINRYIIEKRKSENTHVSIAPLIDLEDKENINFGGELELDENGEISVGELFENNICIPVIQRDYCMGCQIEEENKQDFLQFLLDEFERKCETSKTLVSTIVIAVQKEEENEKKKIYIFDGQQRTYTLYNILKYLDSKEKKDLCEFSFIGRDDGAGSPYSEKAVQNLKNALECRLGKNNVNHEDFKNYIKNQVKFKVQVVDSISGAEQFFMDINGGVPLEKYEIFKSVLYTRLQELESEDVIKKIENEWLQYFYEWKRKVDNLDKKDKEDESDEEEILEMRFIEFVCRFIYNKNHSDSEWGKEEVFDVIKSKSELVAKEKIFIEKLNPKDINEFIEIMKGIEDDLRKISNEEKSGLTKVQVDYNGGNDNNIGNCIWMGTKNTMDRHIRFINFVLDSNISEQKILHAFIWSLREHNREVVLKEFYTEKQEDNIQKILMYIYDNDEILDGYFQKKLKNSEIIYKSYQKREEVSVSVIAGYKIGKMEIKGISLKELPLYYAWDKVENWHKIDNSSSGYIYNVRLVDKISRNKEIGSDKRILFFALTDFNRKEDIIYLGSNKEDIEYKTWYTETLYTDGVDKKEPCGMDVNIPHGIIENLSSKKSNNAYYLRGNDIKGKFENGGLLDN